MIIKNIWDRINFHPFFYIVSIICFFTGHFRDIFYFTTIIIIHELGHSITGIILGMKLKKIDIYPFGGCSKLEHDVNINLYKEMIVLMMGPLTQILFIYLVYILKIDVNSSFYVYSKLILIFNLLPIYPLDGGRILSIFLSYKISFYNSLKLTYYFSYFIYILIVFCLIFLNIKDLIVYLIIISLGIELYKSIENINYIFNKFILERYLGNYSFKKSIIINNSFNMRRDYSHIFKKNDKLYKEKEYLKDFIYL